MSIFKIEESRKKMGKINWQMRELPQEKRDLMKRMIREVSEHENSQFDKMEQFMQHGTTTVRKHCINVAHVALFLITKFGIEVDEEAMIRGCLLHDYFLYDWHDFKIEYLIHGWTHPGLSMRNAIRDFDIGETEQDIIKHHMFPMTPFLPKTKEGWAIVFADKLCAGGETVGDRVNARREAKMEALKYTRPHLLKRGKATIDGQMTKEEEKNANRIRRHGLGITHTGHGVLRRHRVAV